tara:strand:+ start:219 stop:518 length:300 start_codon:yes stop_codon:yes gene_type:complete
MGIFDWLFGGKETTPLKAIKDEKISRQKASELIEDEETESIIDFRKIQSLNPNSSCNINLVFKEKYKHCFFQYKNDLNYEGENISVHFYSLSQSIYVIS